MNRRAYLAGAGVLAAGGVVGVTLFGDDGGGSSGADFIADWLVGPERDVTPDGYRAATSSPRRLAEHADALYHDEPGERELTPHHTTLRNEAVASVTTFNTSPNDVIQRYKVLEGSFTPEDVFGSPPPRFEATEPPTSVNSFEIRNNGSYWAAATEGTAVLYLSSSQDAEEAVSSLEYVLDTGMGRRERYVDRFPKAETALDRLQPGLQTSFRDGPPADELRDVVCWGETVRVGQDGLELTEVLAYEEPRDDADAAADERLSQRFTEFWSPTSHSLDGDVLTIEYTGPMDRRGL